MPTLEQLHLLVAVAPLLRHSWDHTSGEELMKQHRRRVLARVRRAERDQHLLHVLYWWLSRPNKAAALGARVPPHPGMA